MVNLAATYLGVIERATVTVTAPPLIPRFTVVSESQGGDACAIIDALGALDCILDGTSSTGFASYADSGLYAAVEATPEFVCRISLRNGSAIPDHR